MFVLRRESNQSELNNKCIHRGAVSWWVPQNATFNKALLWEDNERLIYETRTQVKFAILAKKNLLIRRPKPMEIDQKTQNAQLKLSWDLKYQQISDRNPMQLHIMGNIWPKMTLPLYLSINNDVYILVHQFYTDKNSMLFSTDWRH